VFWLIRRRDGISEKQYISSVAKMTRPYVSFSTNSKSGCQFFHSLDNKYCIKSLQNENEKRILLLLLQAYCKHIQTQPLSFLCRFYGLHSIRTLDGKLTRYFVVMKNILANRKAISYDLKGSLVNRKVPIIARTRRASLKDEDLRQAGNKFNVGAKRKEMIMKALNADSQFLCQNNIMDYSLILGVYQRTAEEQKCDLKFTDPKLKMFADGGILSEDGKEVYYMGIVDVLQTWNKEKSVQGFFQGLFHNSQNISCCEPNNYASRFQTFMDSIFQ